MHLRLLKSNVTNSILKLPWNKFNNFSCTASWKMGLSQLAKKNYLSHLPNQVYFFPGLTCSLIFYKVKEPRNVSITYKIFDCIHIYIYIYIYIYIIYIPWPFSSANSVWKEKVLYPHLKIIQPALKKNPFPCTAQLFLAICLTTSAKSWAQGEHLTVLFRWATVQLLVAEVSPNRTKAISL